MYKDAGFVVVSQQAIIRDRENNWKPIQYKAADPALPKKTVGRAKVPDTSFVGETKTIPEGRLVPKKARYLPTLRRFFRLETTG